MRFLLILFLFFSNNLVGQIINIDMSNYQSGYFAIQLNNSNSSNDTISVSKCGGIICNHLYEMNRIEINFSFFIRSNGKLINVQEISKTKRTKRKRLYYKNGFLMNFNGKTYLILQIGTKKDLEKTIEIDSPVFIQLLQKIENCKI